MAEKEKKAISLSFFVEVSERTDGKKQTVEADDEKSWRFGLHTFVWPVDDHEKACNTPKNYVNENLLPPKTRRISESQYESIKSLIHKEASRDFIYSFIPKSFGNYL